MALAMPAWELQYCAFIAASRSCHAVAYLHEPRCTSHDVWHTHDHAWFVNMAVSPASSACVQLGPAHSKLHED